MTDFVSQLVRLKEALNNQGPSGAQADVFCVAHVKVRQQELSDTPAGDAGEGIFSLDDFH